MSGGEDGARYGPSLMPGGHKAAWPHVKPIFQVIYTIFYNIFYISSLEFIIIKYVYCAQAICAKANNEPCCDWVGQDGAGHFVKMVHNGIEYGDMQLICETYHIMKDVLGKYSIIY